MLLVQCGLQCKKLPRRFLAVCQEIWRAISYIYTAWTFLICIINQNTIMIYWLIVTKAGSFPRCHCERIYKLSHHSLSPQRKRDSMNFADKFTTLKTKPFWYFKVQETHQGTYTNVTFLQRDRIAWHAERCISHGSSIRPSVRLSVCPSISPSHAGIVPRLMKIGSWGLHYEVAKTL